MKKQKKTPSDRTLLRRADASLEQALGRMGLLDKELTKMKLDRDHWKRIAEIHLQERARLDALLNIVKAMASGDCSTAIRTLLTPVTGGTHNA
jgi:hypothetical protein